MVIEFRMRWFSTNPTASAESLPAGVLPLVLMQARAVASLSEMDHFDARGSSPGYWTYTGCQLGRTSLKPVLRWVNA